MIGRGCYQIQRPVLRAAMLAKRPSCIPANRPRAKAKKAGLAYEAAVAKAIPSAIRGQWFEFTDATGHHGYCQTDLLIPGGVAHERPVVIECKATWTLDGHKQLELLYSPVIEAVCGIIPLGILVTRRVTAETAALAPVIVYSLREALTQASMSRRVVLLWLGKSALV